MNQQRKPDSADNTYRYLHLLMMQELVRAATKHLRCKISFRVFLLLPGLSSPALYGVFVEAEEFPAQPR
jgi:hypothetical protein